MFPCTQRYFHPEKWSVVLPDISSSNCFLCMLQHLKDVTVSAVQKQVCLSLLQQLIVEDDKYLNNILQDDVSLCKQVIDLCTACVSVVQVLQLELIFNHLLNKSKQKIKEFDEPSIQFSLRVVASLQSLCAMYSDILLINHEDYISELLTKAEFMEEETLDNLMLFLRIIMKRIPNAEQFISNDGYQSWPFKLNELITMLLNTVQSVNLCQNVLVLAKEVVCQENAVNHILQLGSTDFSQEDLITGHALTSQGFSFVLGLKRVLARKDESLTQYAVECITLLMGHIAQAEHVQMLMASDVPEIIFEALHTVNSNQVECVFTCLQTLEEKDEFYHGCHAVYGIEPVVKTIKQMLESQRYAVAELGLDLLKHLLKRQPVNMPLFLTQSWTSCYLLLCQALKHNSPAFLVPTVEAAAAFLMPHHQQSPVDIEAISILIAAVKSKILPLPSVKFPSSSVAHLSRTDNFLTMSSQIVFINLIDIVTSVMSLFNSRCVYHGNDSRKVIEFHHSIEETASDLLQNLISQNPLFILCSKESVEKFLLYLDTHLTFSCHEHQSSLPPRLDSCISCSYLSFTTLLIKCGIPWLILKTSSPYRNPKLDVLVSEVLSRLFLLQTDAWSKSLQIKPEDLSQGFCQLEWQETIDEVPKTKEGIQAFFLMLYLSCINGFRPWPREELWKCLHVTFCHNSSVFIGQPFMLKSFTFLTAISEENDNEGSDQIQQYEPQILQEMQKSAVELWYSESIELFKWALSSSSRANVVGKLMIEYWLHQIALDKNEASMIQKHEHIPTGLRGNFAFLSIVVRLLTSHTVSYVARQVLMLAIVKTDCDINKEEKAIWENLLYDMNQILDSAFSPAFDEPPIKNTLPILATLMLKDWDLDKNWLYSVKFFVKVAKYLIHKDRRPEEYRDGLGFLSLLVGRLTSQESKTVIPPLMLDSQFVSLLSSCLHSTDIDLVSPALILGSWISIYGSTFQAPKPLVVTSNYLMSTLASCKQQDIHSILRFINSALRFPCTGCILFTQDQESSPNHRSIFTVTELHQLFIYAQQYVSQENEAVQKEAIDLMENIMLQDANLANSLLHHPWNSLLMETVLNSHSESSLTEMEARLRALLSSSESEEMDGLE